MESRREGSAGPSWPRVCWSLGERTERSWEPAAGAGSAGRGLLLGSPVGSRINPWQVGGFGGARPRDSESHSSGNRRAMEGAERGAGGEGGAWL